MKRYNIYCFGAVPDEVDEAPDGDWVRYEDADAALAMAEDLRAQAQAAAKASHAELEELRARVTRAEGAEKALDEARAEACMEPYGCWKALRSELATAQAAAQRSHAELEALKARVTRAVTVLSTPGTWSEFAAKALKELRGG